MKITISSRKTTVKDSFRDWAEKKLRKLDRFFEEDAQAAIVVTNERERETVEVTVQSRGMIFRAEKTSADRLDSLDAVVESLTRQIVKNKSKLEKKGKAKLSMEGFEAYADYLPPEEEYNVVKVKSFDLKPMNVEEAILQMNMLGHQFYLFQNVENDLICVVYKRYDGNYGLLEPRS